MYQNASSQILLDDRSTQELWLELSKATLLLVYDFFFEKIILGPKAQEYRGLLALKYPMEHGIVTDWNDMERVWQYIYSNDQLKVIIIGLR